MSYKIIIDPNKNTITNTKTKKIYNMVSGDYKMNCHSKKFYTPCGKCQVLEKKSDNTRIYSPLFIRLNFMRLPCVFNENVSRFPYAIHGYGLNTQRQRVHTQKARFNGYITRGCMSLKTPDLVEIYNLLNVGDYIFIKDYNDNNIKNYMKKHSRTKKVTRHGYRQ